MQTKSNSYVELSLYADVSTHWSEREIELFPSETLSANCSLKNAILLAFYAICKYEYIHPALFSLRTQTQTQTQTKFIQHK